MWVSFSTLRCGVKWEERTELQEALKLIKAGDAKILLTWDVSRTHRGDGVFDRLIKEIYSNGGLLAVEKQRRTYKTEIEAQFLLHWEKSVAEYYWKETKYKTFLGKAEAVQRGSYVWSVPFGYKLERENKTNRLVQHPLEAQLLVGAFEYLAEGNGKQATIWYINSLAAQ